MESYEKKYKEALGWMQSLYPAMTGADKEDAEHFFPELKESENERIRKGLLKIFRGAQPTDNWGGLSTKDIIAWLEKQGEQKSIVVIPKFRVGDVIRPKGSTAEYTIESIFGECYHGKGWGLHISGDDDYELVEQKHAWSEEDEKVLHAIRNALNYEKPRNYLKSRDFEFTDILDWLKSIKYRVQPQPRQEWSEEDETALGDALWCCKQAASIAKDENDMGNLWYAEHWLKSLKDRYTWKPSDEQMKALKEACDEH